MAKKKRIKPTPEFNSERETRALLEKVRSEVKTVGEQHGAIKQDLSGIKGKLEGHDKRFDSLDLYVKAVDRKLDNLRDQFGDTIIDHERRIKKVEEKTIV